jgi:hypothetical protein
VSRFYNTGPDDSQAPRELEEYDGPHHGVIRVGDRVVYENPAFRKPDGSYKTGGMDGELVVEEIIDFGVEGVPPQAVLNDGQWECSADNLRAVRP